jgi:hypothetical protein
MQFDIGEPQNLVVAGCRWWQILYMQLVTKVKRVSKLFSFEGLHCWHDPAVVYDLLLCDRERILITLFSDIHVLDLTPNHLPQHRCPPPPDRLANNLTVCYHSFDRTVKQVQG